MLKSPVFAGANDPVTKMLNELFGRTGTVRQVEEGAFVIPGFGFDILVWGRNAPELWMGWPDLAILNDKEGEWLNCYGVCDSPQQFLDKYRDALSADERTFAIGFTHVAKDPENKGHGGGWRWHKWGPYIGDGKPAREYLDDEDGFDDGVYVYSIIQTDGPHMQMDWMSGKLVRVDGDDPESEPVKADPPLKRFANLDIDP